MSIAATTTLQDMPVQPAMSEPITNITIAPLTAASQLRNAPITTMTVRQRRQLAQGRYVNFVALDTTTQEEHAAGRITMAAARKSFQTVHTSLGALEAQAVSTTHINKIVVPAVSSEGLARVIDFVKFCVNECNGRIGAMQTVAHDQLPLYQNMLTAEAAIAIGFKHAYDDAKVKIGRTFYKGGTHRYRFPAADAQAILATTFITTFSTAVKARLSTSVASAYLDNNLNAVQEVNNFMNANPAFNDAVLSEQERIANARAVAAAAPADTN